jgi:hypothetical protein
MSIAPAIRDWNEKSHRVKRLTPGALPICKNTTVCNITVRRSSWAQVRIPSSSTSKRAAAPAGALRRVVPLPPPELSGGVKFTTVVLSLAYDNFGDAGAPATIPATVRILRGSGPIQTLNVNIEVGRKFFHFMHADDQAASVQLNPPAGFRPQVSAMVEYTTP